MGTQSTHTHSDRNQAAAILARLAHGNSINPIQALKLFGCFRLASRISELRKMGVNISSTLITFTSAATGRKGRHSVYWLKGTVDELPEAAKQLLNLQTAAQQ